MTGCELISASILPVSYDIDVEIINSRIRCKHISSFYNGVMVIQLICEYHGSYTFVVRRDFDAALQWNYCSKYNMPSKKRNQNMVMLYMWMIVVNEIND